MLESIAYLKPTDIKRIYLEISIAEIGHKFSRFITFFSICLVITGSTEVSRSTILVLNKRYRFILKHIKSRWTSNGCNLKYRSPNQSLSCHFRIFFLISWSYVPKKFQMMGLRNFTKINNVATNPVSKSEARKLYYRQKIWTAMEQNVHKCKIQILSCSMFF